MKISKKDNLTQKRVLSVGALLAVSCALLLPGRAFAQVVTLTDNGSSATIDLGSSAGMNSWLVNGQNQLTQQWFWYQTGGGVAQPINTIGGLTYTLYPGSSGNNEVYAVYHNSQISIGIDYQLTGGGVGSGNADITENIMAINNSSSSINLNFYQYSHFNLLGASHDTVNIFGGPGAFNYVNQANGGTGIQEAVTSPSANHAEAADASGPSSTLNRLNTVAGLTLNDNTTAGPGDETWALQWGQSIDPGAEFDITKDKSLQISTVPEPSIIALSTLGACVLGFAFRRKAA